MDGSVQMLALCTDTVSLIYFELWMNFYMALHEYSWKQEPAISLPNLRWPTWCNYCNIFRWLEKYSYYPAVGNNECVNGETGRAAFEVFGTNTLVSSHRWEKIPFTVKNNTNAWFRFFTVVCQITLSDAESSAAARRFVQGRLNLCKGQKSH